MDVQLQGQGDVLGLGRSRLVFQDALFMELSAGALVIN